MTGDRVDVTTGAVIGAIGATEEIAATVEVIGEATAEETGAAGDLSAAHMAALIAGIMAGTRRSGVHNSFPKC